MKGIFTTPQRKTFIEAVLQDVETQKETPLFVGKLRHGFEYLVDADSGYSLNFWSNLDDPVYVREVGDALRDGKPHPIYIVPGYERMPLPATRSAMETMLLNNGWALAVTTPNYRRYNSQNTAQRDTQQNP